MRLRNALLAATMLTLPAIPVAVHAQPLPGLYIGAGAGGNIMSDQTLKSVSIPGAFPVTPDGLVPLAAFTGGLTGLNPLGIRNNGSLGMGAGFSGEVSVGYGLGKISPYGGPRFEI
ncbi:MAG: hypothetical protein JOY71_06445, partial [Acetobacteraceae bacterium]|nr:hypothetical protein [Acetobacteraceae bacterium]